LVLRMCESVRRRSMKKLFALVLGCVVAASVYAQEKAERFAGAYYRGDGLGYNVTLVLKEDGRYEAWWDGCLGRYGTAKGNWALKSAKLILTPSEEIEMMKEHLRVLLVRKYDGRFELLPEEDDRQMNSEEEKRAFSFTKREEKAAESPEPTRPEPGSS